MLIFRELGLGAGDVQDLDVSLPIVECAPLLSVILHQGSVHHLGHLLHQDTRPLGVLSCPDNQVLLPCPLHYFLEVFAQLVLFVIEEQLLDVQEHFVEDVPLGLLHIKDERGLLLLFPLLYHLDPPVILYDPSPEQLLGVSEFANVLSVVGDHPVGLIAHQIPPVLYPIGYQMLLLPLHQILPELSSLISVISPLPRGILDKIRFTPGDILDQHQLCLDGLPLDNSSKIEFYLLHIISLKVPVIEYEQLPLEQVEIVILVLQLLIHLHQRPFHLSHRQEHLHLLVGVALPG